MLLSLLLVLSNLRYLKRKTLQTLPLVSYSNIIMWELKFVTTLMHETQISIILQQVNNENGLTIQNLLCLWIDLLFQSFSLCKKCQHGRQQLLVVVTATTTDFYWPLIIYEWYMNMWIALIFIYQWYSIDIHACHWY